MSDDVMVGVVLASRGYPESSESGQVIAGIAEAEQNGATVFHAGTAETNGQIVTAGGRVLTVVARGSGFADAIERTYRGVRAISFSGLQFRTDIGRKALQPQV